MVGAGLQFKTITRAPSRALQPAYRLVIALACKFPRGRDRGAAALLVLLRYEN